ncbi:hypothetical protein K7X08_008375 [Anisodus acutangulus]|uniref:Uncharacterized protein n=1 Tax=Anisodus acutangulus TaxID=402998 RepID=A0A9Q1MQB6_9SOLA|nr:hypothetical protein K7X08_008375 [Anisodus acutangulus]
MANGIVRLKSKQERFLERGYVTQVIQIRNEISKSTAQYDANKKEPKLSINYSSGSKEEILDVAVEGWFILVL